jgi:hypothetical protein
VERQAKPDESKGAVDQSMPAEFDIESLMKAYEFNLLYAQELVKDLDSDLMYRTFGPGVENYPAFTLGHLVIASALIAEDLGHAYEVPEGWDEHFRRKGPGDERLPGPYKEGMPTREDLLEELGQKHSAVDRLIRGSRPDMFSRRIEWRFDRHFPAIGDYLVFMCLTHEAMHLGQLAAWRRAAGLPSALARL